MMTESWLLAEETCPLPAPPAHCTLPDLCSSPCHSPQSFCLLGYCSIYIRNDDLVIPVPQVNGPCTATGTLILGCNTKHYIIWTILELQFRLL